MLRLRGLAGGTSRRSLAPTPHGGPLGDALLSQPRVQCRRLYCIGSPTYPISRLGVARTSGSIQDACRREGPIWSRSQSTQGSSQTIFSQILEAGAGGRPQALKLLVRHHARQATLRFDFDHCAAWLNKWAKVDPKHLKGHAPREVLLVLSRALQLLSTKQRSIKSKPIALVANAVCKLDYVDTEARDALMQELAQWCMARGLAGFQPQGIGMLVNAFARNAPPPPPSALLELICRRCEEMELRDFNPQGLSNLINGLAKMNHDPGTALLKLLCQRCEETEQDFTPQGLSNLINGLAKLNHYPGKALLELLCRRCEEMELRGFTPQGLCILVNGLAKLSYDPGKPLLELLCRRCEEMELRGFPQQGLCILVNGLTKLAHVPEHSLLDLLCVRTREMGLESFESRSLAILINGLAGLRYSPGEAWLSDVSKVCRDRGFEGFMPHELAVLVHALTLLGAPVDADFARAFSSRASQLGWDKFDGQGMSLSLWAMAVMQQPMPEDMLQAVAAKMTALKTHLSEPRESHEYLDAAKVCMAARQYLYLIDPHSWGQAEHELSSAVEVLRPLVAAYYTFRPLSKLQGKVCAALRKRLYEIEEEVPLADGLLSVDALITLPCGSRVAVEVDGPLHFFCNRPDEPTGATVLKRQLLTRAQARGEVQAWVWVRVGSQHELRKIELAVERARQKGQRPPGTEPPKQPSLTEAGFEDTAEHK